MKKISLLVLLSLFIISGCDQGEATEVANEVTIKSSYDFLREVEITELSNRKERAKKTSSILENIKISNPKFYWVKQYDTSSPIIDFTITNDTSIAIAAGSFHGEVISQGRSIPWVSENFNYDFKGGLEPGESQHLKLSPNILSDWQTPETKDRKDLVMTVDVLSAENAEGESIAVYFGEAELKRLETLLK